MTTSNGTAARSVEGIVEGRNDNGIKLNGEWLNLSKFGERPELPPRGAAVRVLVNGKGFLEAVQVLSAGSGPAPARDKTITKLAVLKAAANFAADRTDVKSSDVLRIADLWLAWVETEEGDRA